MNPHHIRARGFTLVELLVVTGIIALLISVLLPALHKARESAKQTACASNLRQIHAAVQLYAHDHRNFLPPKFEVKKKTLTAKELSEGKRLNTLEDGIQLILKPYVGQKLFACPADFGDLTDPTPVVQQIGTSYEVRGAEYKIEKDPAKQAERDRKNRLSLRDTRDIASDLFKPWDSEDPKKVQEKIDKGERGPVRWHKKYFNKVMGDGRVISIDSKAADKESKGETSDD